MRAPKYAKKVDGNQQEIVDALRKAGCSVVVIGTPVDLLVGRGAKNWLFEVKRPGEKPRTPAQKQFLRDWKGQVRIVESAEEAIAVVSDSYKGVPRYYEQTLNTPEDVYAWNASLSPGVELAKLGDTVKGWFYDEPS